MINYSKLPEHMQDGMRRYIEQGILPGGFALAVLANNLVEAFGRADHINSARMRDWADFLYNEAPGVCWGSDERIRTWHEKGGLNGFD